MAVHTPLLPMALYNVGTVGQTLITVPVKLPGCQVKVLAPVAVRVAQFPVQILVWLALAVTVGVDATTIWIVDVAAQVPLDPVTVYTVVMVGPTAMAPPVWLVGYQVYDEAPVALIVLEAPAQMLKDVAVVVIAGKGLTVTLTVFVSVQLPILPVTVYIVVRVGLITMDEVVAPLLQTYVEAPEAASVADAPEHML